MFVFRCLGCIKIVARGSGIQPNTLSKQMTVEDQQSIIEAFDLQARSQLKIWGSSISSPPLPSLPSLPSSPTLPSLPLEVGPLKFS